MALTKAKFQALATKLINKTFGDFRDTLVMRTLDDVVYGSDQTYTNETGLAIPTSIDSKQFESQMIELGDFKLITDAAQWSTVPKVGDVDLIFGGTQWPTVNLTIKDVKKDAANAAYTMIVRAK